MLGEFGRTPKINGQAGRDHWPDCYSVVLAGGGVTGGAMYGTSDKLGAYPDLNPVTPGDLAATIFWRFGLDPPDRIARYERPAVPSGGRRADLRSVWLRRRELPAGLVRSDHS